MRTLLLCFTASAVRLVFNDPMLAGPRCEQLLKLGTATIQITTAETVSSGKFSILEEKAWTDLPPFCRVAATLHPSTDSWIRIELWMPEAHWNGRLEGTGNGGFAGDLSYGALANGLKHGYATVNTDMGMATSPGQDATVFIDRPERWKDWGYRATHEMTVEGKRLVAAFYGRRAKHSYFVGCSTGGQQAWSEAERYPQDYDGIVGGAPANNRTGVHESILCNFISTEQTPDNHLPAIKIRALAKAVMNACDRLDGLTDNIISNPETCRFDPGSLECPVRNNETCLTASQVSAVRHLYAGPRDERTGQQIYPGMPKGSELGWDRLGPDSNGNPPFAPIFKWVFGLNWNWHQFDFDRSVETMQRKLAPDLNATDFDQLNRFHDLGHKLLIYHGWADCLVVPGQSLNDRNALASSLRGKNLDSFYRLYMVPGMTHCSGGDGPDTFDALTTVVNWVETNRAPERIIASQFQNKDHIGKP